MAFGSLNRFGLGLLFTARDLITPTMMKMQKSLKDTGVAGEKMAQDIGRGLKQMGVGAGIAVAGVIGLVAMKKTADVAGKFEFQMAAVNEIMGTSAEQFRELNDLALSAKVAFAGFKPVEAAEGLRLFAQGGLQAASAMDALNPTLDMAAASLGELTIEKSAGLAIGAMKVFGFEANELRGALDRMAKATFISRMKFKDLPLALGIVARGVNSVDASLEDTLLSLSLTRNVIDTVERSATAVATAMMKLSTERAQKRLGKLGVAFKDLNTGGFRPFLNIVGDMIVELEKMDIVERKTWRTTTFGVRSVAGLNAIMSELTKLTNDFGGISAPNMGKAIDSLRKKMAGADGTVRRLRDAMLDTFEGFKKVLGAAKNFLGTVIGLEFGKVLAPPLILLSNALIAAASAFRRIPGPIKAVLALMFALASTAAVIIGLVLLVKGALLLLPAAALAGLGVALVLFGKILLVTAAVGAAIIALVVLWKTNFGGIQDFVTPIINKIRLAWKGLVELIRFGAFSDATFKELNLGFNQGILKFVIRLFMLGHRIKKFFVGLFSTLAAFWEPIRDSLTPLFFELSEGLGEVWKIIVMVLEELGIGQNLVNGSSSTWEKWGKAIGYTIGLLALVGVNLIKWVLLPMLKVAKWTTRITRFLIGVFRPLITFFKTMGLIITAVLLGPLGLFFAALIAFGGSIKEIFKSVVDFLVNFLLGPIRMLISHVVSLAKLIPGLKGTQLVKDLDDWSSKPISVFGTATPEPQIGRVVDRSVVMDPGQTMSASRLSQRSAAGTVGQQTAKESAIRQKEKDTVLQNHININIDSDPLQEFLEIKKRRDLARRGAVIPAESSSTDE